jgi:DNA-binding NarL/FixJ family response regulator/tRNA A-37 threonylcarbamoyl transferase component Bud32
MSTVKQISIFIAEDQLIPRMGLRMLLEQTSSFAVVGEAEDGESAVQKIRELKPDIVMMDLEMPKMGGVEATEIIKKEMPHVKVLIFTSLGEDASIFAALKAGADGYCLKNASAEMLASAIHSVLSGAAWLDPAIAGKVLRAHASPQSENKPDLSESKLKLLTLVGEGKAVDEIASEMNINDALAKALLGELVFQLKGSKENTASARNPSPASTSLKAGDVVGSHYRIDGKLGEGGMGCVYSAVHALIDRKAAIKTLNEYGVAAEITRERFRIEAKASAGLSHPNLVTIFDYGLIDDRIPYLVMEFLDGISLAQLLKQPQDIENGHIMNIFIQVSDALHTVHSHGIVHRDLKPSNIMLIRRADSTYIVKLVDFGIAKIVEGPSQSLTNTGECIGSPLYMSPEQCMCTGIDHRTDLYSLGCTMYEAFTREPPFIGNTALETMMRHVSADPDIEPLKANKVPKKVISLILQLLAKDPAKRPSSAAAVREVLLKA